MIERRRERKKDRMKESRKEKFDKERRNVVGMKIQTYQILVLDELCIRFILNLVYNFYFVLSYGDFTFFLNYS